MKKTVVFLVAMGFLVFAYLGYKAASRFAFEKKIPSSEVETPGASDFQQNFLLIHVTDTSNLNPSLITAWVVLVYYSQPVQLMFLPVFPTGDSLSHQELTTAFRIVESGEIDSGFMEEIQKMYDLVLHGYIVVDNTSLSTLSAQLESGENYINFQPPQSDDQELDILQNARERFQDACNGFSTEGTSHFFDGIPWTKILPEHFHTNLSFEELTLAMERISNADQIEQCIVFSNE